MMILHSQHTQCLHRDSRLAPQQQQCVFRRSSRRHPGVVSPLLHHRACLQALSSGHDQVSTQLEPQPASSSRREALMLGAGAGLLLGGSGAAAAEQEVVAESLPAPTTAPTPATAPVPDNSLLSQLKSKLPPLADRPGASGKQLLQDPVEFTYAFQSDVPCDLRVKQYYQLIVGNRPKVWQRIAAQIQASAFQELDEGLKVDAMADLRQAALFTPWALLQRDDYVASVEVRKGYLSLNAHIQDLQNAAAKAAGKESSADRVQQAFILMSASLDEFLSRIPNKYKDGPQGAQESSKS